MEINIQKDILKLKIRLKNLMFIILLKIMLKEFYMIIMEIIYQILNFMILFQKKEKIKYYLFPREIYYLMMKFIIINIMVMENYMKEIIQITFLNMKAIF